MLLDRCPVCLSCPVLSVTLVCCAEAVGRIKMKLGTEVGLGPGHIVLDGDPAPYPKRWHSPQFLAHVCFGQTARSIKIPLDTNRGRPRPTRYCVRCGPSSPPPKKGGNNSPPILAMYCGQTAGSRCHLVWT